MAEKAIEKAQKSFAAEMVKYQELQTKAQRIATQRQQLEAQLTENKLVKEVGNTFAKVSGINLFNK